MGQVCLYIPHSYGVAIPPVPPNTPPTYMEQPTLHTPGCGHSSPPHHSRTRGSYPTPPLHSSLSTTTLTQEASITPHHHSHMWQQSLHPHTVIQSSNPPLPFTHIILQHPLSLAPALTVFHYLSSCLCSKYDIYVCSSLSMHTEMELATNKR